MLFVPSSIADASRLKKQNFMSDKKKNNFFPLLFCSRAKNSEKKFNFFIIEIIVIIAVVYKTVVPLKVTVQNCMDNRNNRTKNENTCDSKKRFGTHVTNVRSKEKNKVFYGLSQCIS
jgi:hypothetical protein